MEYVIIADDLTGANATCSLLKKVGLSTTSLFSLDGRKNIENEVVAYSTDSRAVDKKEAYKRVYEATLALKQEKNILYNKRIDSTLRGNIGVEIEAMLDVIGKVTPVIVPAYPDSGRIVVNEVMLVNGMLLKNSDAGRDTKTPVMSSNVRNIIEKQTKMEIKYFCLEDISKSENELINLIKKASADNKILIFDAVKNEDIVKIAKCLVKSKIKILTVDPGPFTMHYIQEIKKENKMNKKILMVIGSATETTKLQIEHLLQKEDVFLIKLNPRLFFNKETCEKEIERVCKLVKKGIDSYELFMLTTTPIGDDERLNLKEIAENLKITVDDVSKIIANSLTEVATRILLELRKFEGVYSSGGDITLSLLEKLESSGIEIKDEVIPLAAYGRLIDGKIKNLKLVSKGGMVGDIDTIKLCLNKIKNDI